MSTPTRCWPVAFVLCALALTCGAVAEDAAPAKAPTLLVVQSEPAGANISIDGAPSGHTPLMLFQVTPGKHHVAGTLEDHEVVEQDVEVKAQETTTIKLVMPNLFGTLSLTTTATIDCTLGTIHLAIKSDEMPVLKVPAGELAIHCQGDVFNPINQSVRIKANERSTFALTPTRIATSSRIRVENPDGRKWELRNKANEKICSLPCSTTWPGPGMTIQISTDLTTVDRETKKLPDDMPFLPSPGTVVDSTWRAGQGSIAKGVVGLSLSVALLGAAIPLCVINAKSESGTNVGAGIGCIAAGALGLAGGILSTVSLVSYAPSGWKFEAAPDFELKSLRESDDKLRVGFALGANGARASLMF